MAKKTNGSITHNVEITSAANTVINGDVVGRDKAETNVSVFVRLDQKKSKHPTKRIDRPQKKKKSFFSSDLDRHYLTILGGMMLIFSGILLVSNIITISAISKIFDLSGSAGVNPKNLSEPSETVQSQVSPLTETTVTLTSSDCNADIEILDNTGNVILALSISRYTTQTFSLPAGSYTYNVKYDCSGGLAGSAGIPLPKDYSKSFYLSTDGNVKIGTPARPKLSFPFSLDQVVGIILIIIGSGLMPIVYKKVKREHESKKQTGNWNSSK